MRFSRAVLLVSLIVAAVAFELPASTYRQLKVQSCAVKADCKPTCDCLPVNGKSCVDLQAFSKFRSACPKCTVDGDCDSYGCNEANGICESCYTESFAVGLRSCTDQPVAVKPVPGNCVKDADCPTAGCGCIPLGGVKYCFNPTKLANILGECKKCSTDADCDANGCSATGYCKSCTEKAAVTVKKSCPNVAALANAKPAPTAPPKSIPTIPTVAPTPAAPTFTPEPAVAVAEGDLVPSPEPEAEAVEAAAEKAPCVETAWLLKNDLMHAAIRHAGVTRVMCMPGLPCGTPGHLLRQNAALVTYREVCESRTDCVENTAAVSQLSHTYDWSRFSAGSLQLTSLSAHPESNARSVSRVIANVADKLNQNGLGSVCNVVAALPFKLSNALDKLMVSAFESN